MTSVLRVVQFENPANLVVVAISDQPTTFRRLFEPSFIKAHREIQKDVD